MRPYTPFRGLGGLGFEKSCGRYRSARNSQKYML